MIVGVDAGNYQVKVVSQNGVDIFPSDLGEYRERNLEQKFSSNDMVVEYKNRKFFAGTLAQYESEFTGSMMGESKAHEDCKLRVLIALHRAGCDSYKIVVGQPIGQHTREEKEKIKKMLFGYHSISVNGVRRNFIIERVEVAAEGGAAFWSCPESGLVRVIDIGSGTVNCATLHDRRYIDKDSFTILIGANTTKTQNYLLMARAIATHVYKKWNPNDVVKLAGGPARDLFPFLQEYFTRISLIAPSVGGGMLDPVFANAVGFYKIGAEIYDC